MRIYQHLIVALFICRYTAVTPYGYHLEAAREETSPLTLPEYEPILGRKERFPDLLRFFDDQVEQHGIEAVLAEFMPRLVQGAAGALTHGIIHLGWGLDGESRWMTTEGAMLADCESLPCSEVAECFRWWFQCGDHPSVHLCSPPGVHGHDMVLCISSPLIVADLSMNSACRCVIRWSKTSFTRS